jgi:hypothetical protein
MVLVMLFFRRHYEQIPRDELLTPLNLAHTALATGLEMTQYELGRKFGQAETTAIPPLEGGYKFGEAQLDMVRPFFATVRVTGTRKTGNISVRTLSPTQINPVHISAQYTDGSVQRETIKATKGCLEIAGPAACAAVIHELSKFDPPRETLANFLVRRYPVA